MTPAERAALFDAPAARIDQKIKVELVLGLSMDLGEGDGREEVESAVEMALRLWSERMRGQALSRMRSIRLTFDAARMPAEGLHDLEMEEV